MPKGPVRRAQLIAPFGVGAMLVAKDGTSLVTGGLDHWYELESGEKDSRYVNPDDFVIEEWRLQRLLHVDHFKLPPDYRKPKSKTIIPNCRLTIPFLRFPQWHFCPKCNYLSHLPLSIRQRQRCGKCPDKKKSRFLLQVPFVAMCERGHLQDFPWREWVHSAAKPKCELPMRLLATGGATLAAQKVVCDCKLSRTLNQITQADKDGKSTFLTTNLDKSAKFECQGKRPWLGTEEGELCQYPLRGSLRSAANVYFANQVSAIYLPRAGGSAPPKLIELLSQPPLSGVVNLFKATDPSRATPQALRAAYPHLLFDYKDVEIIEALRLVLGGEKAAAQEEEDEIAFRHAEFQILRSDKKEGYLLIKKAPLNKYEPDVVAPLAGMTLVHKLRETRTFAGFSRVLPEGEQSLLERKALLWRSSPPPQRAWLPAYVVHGEGLFIEFDAKKLDEWEEQSEVRGRIAPLRQRIELIQTKRGARKYDASARLVMIHTLSHLLINRLTYECGYSSAALRERLYVSRSKKHSMAALLIYTAAGDAEGTMGGLVRMGKPGLFEPMVRRALESSSWCSADPVCMELGSKGGQGPDSCNLAACHNCALIPETACEMFNRILDRALVIGTPEEPRIGFFNVGQ